jgi:hypothetical protein
MTWCDATRSVGVGFHVERSTRETLRRFLPTIAKSTSNRDMPGPDGSYMTSFS